LVKKKLLIFIIIGIAQKALRLCCGGLHPEKKKYRYMSQPCYGAAGITSKHKQPYAATSLINSNNRSSECCLASFCELWIALTFRNAHIAR
jgi:hypothetical protein